MLEEVANALLTGCGRGRQGGEATDAAHALLRAAKIGDCQSGRVSLTSRLGPVKPTR